MNKRLLHVGPLVLASISSVSSVALAATVGNVVDIDQMVRLVRDLGFPIFVAVYLLTIGQRALNRNTQALGNLETAINRFIDKHS